MGRVQSTAPVIIEPFAKKSEVMQWGYFCSEYLYKRHDKTSSGAALM